MSRLSLNALEDPNPGSSSSSVLPLYQASDFGHRRCLKGSIFDRKSILLIGVVER